MKGVADFSKPWGLLISLLLKNSFLSEAVFMDAISIRRWSPTKWVR